MDNKEFYEKTEEFAKRIVKLAVDERLTVREFCESADMAQGVVYNSIIGNESIENTDFPSRHIAEQPKMLFTPEDSSGTKYSAQSISIPCPLKNHK